MALNQIHSSAVSPLSDNNYHCCPQKRSFGNGLPQKNLSIDARMVSEYYSSNSLSLTYTSKDGDSVSFSMESVEYSKSILEVSAEGDKEDMDKLIDYIKQSFDAFKKEVLNSFLKSIGVETSESEEANTTEAIEKTDMLEIPEYWNAENTSQRIVDFALSFFDLYEGSGDEFLTMIKNAIDEGFNQARELMGELPEEVADLVDDTYSLAMEKLEAWAIEKEISVPESGEEIVA